MVPTLNPDRERDFVLLRRVGLRISKSYAIPLALIGAGMLSSAPIARGQIEFDPPIIFEDYGGRSVACGDFDLDGDTDIALGQSPDGCQLLQNDGSGNFSEWVRVGVHGSTPWAIEVGDIDHDGDLDMLLVRHVQTINRQVVAVAINEDRGESWSHSLSEEKHDLRSVALGDFDGDNDLEAILGFDDRIALCQIEDGVLGNENNIHNRGAEHLDARSLATGDFDQDGDLDIAALLVDGYRPYSEEYYAVSKSEIAILLNDGSGGFAQFTSTPLPYRDKVKLAPRRIASGDLDGDGDLDLALVVGETDYVNNPAPAEFRVLENRGARRPMLVRERTQFSISDAYDLRLADLDADGRLDILASTRIDRLLYTFRNRGGMRFGPQRSFSSGITIVQMDPEDLDGDGRLDIASATYVALAILYNATEVTNPTMEVSPLIRGEPATISVTGVEPHETVWIAASRSAWEPSWGVRRLGGLTLDIPLPAVDIIPRRADAQGVARLDFIVPDTVATGPVSFQAAVRRGTAGQSSVKSLFEYTLVQE